MSDVSGKKNKLKKTQGWEEAGGEFYQESYNSEWDVLPKDTFTITTLLPSKQGRIGTCKRPHPRSNDVRNTKGWAPFSTTTQRGCKQNDGQFSILPDLSQVLTDEERIWEEMLQIKLMPISMQHKKELKISLQSATKLRLQGFNQLKWKHRKLWQKSCERWNELRSRLGLWKSSFKQVEGHFGTGVVAYFRFLRWLFFLNCLTFGMIFMVIVLPSILTENSKKEKCITMEYVSQNASRCIQNTKNESKFPITVIDYIQEAEFLKYTFLFYGAYRNKSEQNQNQGHIYYDLPLAYISITIIYFFIALVSIVRATAREFKDPLISGKWQFYRYCNIVFGGWDYCIHNCKTSNIKHISLYNEIKYLLQSKRIELERNNRSRNFMFRLIIIRLIVNITIIAILLLSAYVLYILLNISLKQQNILYSDSFYQKNTHNSSMIITRESNTLESENDQPPQSVLLDFSKIFIEYVPYIVIVGLNLTLPIIFNYLSKFEKYSPFFLIKISLFRTIFLRLASLAILLSRFYYLVIPQSQIMDQTKSAFECWETFVGQQFIKLLITDFISHLIVTFCINFPRAICAKNLNYNIVKFFGEQEFELPKHVLDIIYFQTICWLGSFYSPVLPGLVAIIIFFMFYIKKFQCLVNSKPSKFFYGVSRSNSLFMFILLLSFFVAVIPITFAIAEIRPSLKCGPFKGLNSVWDVLLSAFESMPAPFKNFLFFLGSPSFSIPCFLVLVLLLYYFHAVSDANKNMVEVLKNQLTLEGHDKQFLLNRLSVFLKQTNQERNIQSSIKPN